MKVLALVIACWATAACGPSLTGPSPTEQSRLQEAIALIRRSPDRLPFDTRPLGQWFDARVSGVYVNTTHPEFIAYRERETGRVFVSTETMAYPIPELAAALLHEARHADVSHTCGLNDLTLEEWGAWAVEAWFLERQGYQSDADSIRRDQICTH